MITGSKFAGGPAFSGALLAPSAFVNADCRDLVGLAEFSARDDWPACWDKCPRDLSVNRNLGLLLRWEAALAEIDVYEAASDRARQACLDIFGDAVRDRVAACSKLMLLPGGQPGRSDTIFTIMTGGQWRDGAGALKLRAALAESGPTRCHVGQPVAIDSGAALRVCASMPMINDALLCCAAGAAPSRAMKPILAQLDALFCLWNDIARAALARAC